MPDGATSKVRFICSGLICLLLFTPHILAFTGGVETYGSFKIEPYTSWGWVSAPPALPLNLDRLVTVESNQVSDSNVMRLSRLDDERRYHTCLVCWHSHSQHRELLQRKVQVPKPLYAGAWSVVPAKQLPAFLTQAPAMVVRNQLAVLEPYPAVPAPASPLTYSHTALENPFWIPDLNNPWA